MGIERAVVRWYAQRQVLLEELALLDAEASVEAGNAGDAKDATETVTSEELRQQREQKRAETERRLRLLGPCPTPMMG